jgi:hypothetical protein
MKKILSGFFTILALVVSSSCSLGSGEGLFSVSGDNATMDRTFELFIEAINKKDADALKSVFAKEVFAKFDNFDEQIANLFDFIDGEITSWVRNVDPSAAITKERSGLIWKQLQAKYSIIAGEQTYHVSILEVVTYNRNPDVVGVRSFTIIKAEDWHNDYIYSGDLGKPEHFKILGIVVEESKKIVIME